MGFEPTASALQVRRATHCVTRHAVKNIIERMCITFDPNFVNMLHRVASPVPFQLLFIMEKSQVTYGVTIFEHVNK